MTSAAFAPIANSVNPARKRRIAFCERNGIFKRLRRDWLGSVFGEADRPKVNFTLRPGCWCGRCWSGRVEIELNRRRFFRTRLRRKERFRRKTQHARDEVRRDTAHRHVVLLDGVVEVSALDGDSVLGSFKLCL